MGKEINCPNVVACDIVLWDLDWFSTLFERSKLFKQHVSFPQALFCSDSKFFHTLVNTLGTTWDSVSCQKHLGKQSGAARDQSMNLTSSRLVPSPELQPTLTHPHKEIKKHSFK